MGREEGLQGVVAEIRGERRTGRRRGVRKGDIVVFLLFDLFLVLRWVADRLEEGRVSVFYLLYIYLVLVVFVTTR